MEKKYIVRLTDEERHVLRDVVKELKGTSQKVRRAQVLLKADAEDRVGPTRELRKRFPVERRPWRTSGSGW